MHPDVERVLLSEADIHARVAEMGRQITRDYAGKKLLVVGILKGSVIFLSDLMRKIDLPCEIDFICLKSYSGQSSTGVVQLLLDLRESAEGRDLLLVEDIVDTGLTLNYLNQNLMTRKPKSLEICSLLDKPDCRKVRVNAKYVGFKIPNEFVVGYGLDYNEKYRNLPYIGVLKTPARG
ncbi:MAG: hypoxanthine phosphoribosyltransferase [Elusimicrobia bacterium]|nr:hypoxanthine phosphoribosyltransferase [Elusimicrobiota bacterium]